MNRKTLLVLAFFSLVFCNGFYAHASQSSAASLMSLEEVEKLIDSSPGKEVKAYFKSTPRGIEPLSYDIILRGIHEKPGLKVIVFVMSGQIAAGMSGSPVYINGKHIGALAYRLNNHNTPRPSWGAISPISQMMKEANSGQRSGNMVRAFSYLGMTFEPIAVGYEPIPGFESANGERFITTTSRIGPGAVRAKKPKLKPGMPIIVDLIEWTDEKNETTTVSALGTVTYIDKDGRIFAFGHPFLDSRKVVYSFRTAEIMGTVPSDDNAYKLSWKKSEILGVITFDSTYGIYGSLASSNNARDRLHEFNLEFNRNGKLLNNFKIKVADSILTPVLAQTAFQMIGQSYGAPLPQEKSVTQIETKLELEGGYKPVVWRQLFTPRSFKFGPRTIYTSSYDAAHETFFEDIYADLFVNNYGLKIAKVDVSANFISGRSQVFKLGAYKFPNKIVWGQDPVLELLLVSRDNTTEPLAKRVKVKIDWDQVEKPVYTKTTLETEKTSEKVVKGFLTISSSTRFFQVVTASGGSEKQKFLPDYYLGPEDFLVNFSRRLEITNQKIFARVALKAKSGLFDRKIAEAEDLMPKDLPENGSSEWYVLKEGLNERKHTVTDEGVIYFYIDLPPVSNGYVVDDNLGEAFSFEVVLE